MYRTHRILATVVLLVLIAVPAASEVVRVVVDSRADWAEGRRFGRFGAYERLRGRIFLEFDPANPANDAIVDLALAPRNPRGRVEAWANFDVIRPKSPEIPTTALLEVSNRGGQASLRYFGRDELLMTRGFTVIWVGWQFDVPQGGRPRMRLHVPRARAADGSRITGLVRSDWTVDAATEVLDLAHRNHVAYPVLDPKDAANVLTKRTGRDAERVVVPRGRWRFVAGRRDGSLTRISMPGGFEPGHIYELVYRAADPAVVGLGLATIRDVMSYARHDEACPFPVSHGIAVGISQTGRFLRHFLYQGFNEDEKRRRAFDGLLIHTAGAGRGSFNHRFAQPSRDAHRYSAFFYPTDIYPFSGRVQRLGRRREGIQSHPRTRRQPPKVFYTNTGYEYWGRAASLLHTSLDGSADVEPLSNERIYHLASTQHFPVGLPRRPWDGKAVRGNPIDLLSTERALLLALQDWVVSDVEPPPSAHPRIDDGTAVPIDELAFPELPDLPRPTTIHSAHRADYGPDFRSRGIVSVQPPALGPAFPTLVSRVDAYGNEVAGIRSVETLVPLGTFAPWHLRAGLPGGNGELTDFYGTFLPLPRTEAEREARGDPRPSIASRWSSKDAYLKDARTAAGTLVERRHLLAGDVEHVVRGVGRLWDWIHADVKRPR